MAQDKKPLTDNELQGALERAFLMRGREVKLRIPYDEFTVDWIREVLCTHERILEELQAARKALKVTWIPCEERMPDTPRDVWVDPSPFSDEDSAPIAAWSIDEWWADDRPLENPGFTHWAEIAWPEPPQKEGGGSSEAQS